ncbi:MAG: S8 family serine peptidase [Pseudomonadota bacterium]
MALHPTGGVAGSQIVVQGTSFGTDPAKVVVAIGSLSLAATDFSLVSADEIRFTIPPDAATGDVVVTVDGLASNGFELAVGSTFVPAPLTTEISDSQNVLPSTANELIVEAQDAVTFQEIAGLAASMSAAIVGYGDLDGIYLLRFEPAAFSDPNAVIAQLKTSPLVSDAYLNLVFRLQEGGASASFPQAAWEDIHLWDEREYNAVSYLNQPTSSGGQTLAALLLSKSSGFVVRFGVVDSGMKRDHAEFEGVAVATESLSFASANEDADGHGTTVAAVIGANKRTESDRLHGVFNVLDGAAYRLQTYRAHQCVANPKNANNPDCDFVGFFNLVSVLRSTLTRAGDANIPDVFNLSWGGSTMHTAASFAAGSAVADLNRERQVFVKRLFDRYPDSLFVIAAGNAYPIDPRKNADDIGPRCADSLRYRYDLASMVFPSGTLARRSPKTKKSCSVRG